MDNIEKEYRKLIDSRLALNEERLRIFNIRRSMSCPYYQKWDIVMAEFGKRYDCCLIRGYRPAIVMSDASYNEKSPIMHVIPLTKQFKGIDMEYHVFLDKKDCIGYDASGMALVEQIQPIDRKNVNRKIGEVDGYHALDRIQEAVEKFYGMGKEY